MKFSSEVIRKAHKMTKKIRKEYDVDYRFQFGICLKYLLSEIKGVEKVMVELVGSEKQIKWGNDIKETIGKVLQGSIDMELEENKKVLRQREATKKLINSIEAETSASKLIDLFEDTYNKNNKNEVATIAFHLRLDMDRIGKKFGLDEKETLRVECLLQKYYHKNR